MRGLFCKAGTAGRQGLRAGDGAVVVEFRRQCPRGEALCCIIERRADLWYQIDHMYLRYMWWNFVSSRKERIQKAINDWKRKRFANLYDDNGTPAQMPETDSYSLMSD